MTDNDNRLTAYQAEILMRNASKIISGPGGELTIADAVRSVLVFFSNGVLVAADSAKYDPNVMIAREDIRRRGYHIAEEFQAEAPLIHGLYQAKANPEAAG